MYIGMRSGVRKMTETFVKNVKCLANRAFSDFDQKSSCGKNLQKLDENRKMCYYTS